MSYIVIAGSLVFTAGGCARAGEELTDAGAVGRDTAAPGEDAGGTSTESDAAVEAGETSATDGRDAGSRDAETAESPDPPDGSFSEAGVDADMDAGAGAGADPDAAAAEAGSAGDASLDGAAVDREGGTAGDASSDGPVGDAQAGDAGTDIDAAPDAGSDANPGTDADAAVTTSTCASGLYEGTFEGELRARIGLLVIELPPVSGEVQLFADEAEEGGRLVIDDGTLSAVDNEGDSVYARISGVVDCDTGVLEDGRLTNGVYRRESLDQTVEFEGTVAGTYMHEPTPRVEGTWEVDGRFESGEGTFAVHLKGAAP